MDPALFELPRAPTPLKETVKGNKKGRKEELLLHLIIRKARGSRVPWPCTVAATQPLKMSRPKSSKLKVRQLHDLINTQCGVRCL